MRSKKDMLIIDAKEPDSNTKAFYMDSGWLQLKFRSFPLKLLTENIFIISASWLLDRRDDFRLAQRFFFGMFHVKQAAAFTQEFFKAHD
jgi:hypothetical protein